MAIGRNERALFFFAGTGCLLAMLALLILGPGGEGSAQAAQTGASNASRPTSGPASRAATSRPSEWLSTAPTPAAAALTPEQFPAQDYAAFLSRIVAPDGMVRYERLVNEDREALSKLVQAIERTDWRGLQSAAEDAREAWLVNAYNILTLETIVDHWPVASIMDIEKPWDTPMPVAGRHFTLNEIEHEQLRLRNAAPDERRARVDPRLHFAVNCASIGCPVLQQKPFTADNLDALYDEGVREFIANPRNFHFENGTLSLSELLQWYGDDFLLVKDADSPEKAVAAFFADYVEDEAVAEKLRAGDFEVEWLTYDWGLNQARN